MAPGTRTGAASPIIAIGGFTIGVDETLRKKITNDAMAFLRSYSEKRGRNAKLAETAVTEAKAFTETESLDGKLIDYVAATPEELLRSLNGKTITRFDGTQNHSGPHKLSAFIVRTLGAAKVSRAHRRAGHVFPAADFGHPRPVR